MTGSPHYRAVSFLFEVTCDDPRIEVQLRRVLAPLLTSAGAAHSTRFSLTAPVGSGLGSLTVDDAVVLRSRSGRRLYQALLACVNQGAVDHSADHVLLHAAAAELHGRGVVISGPSEAGKTTLVAGLARAGFRYVTDEITAIRPCDLAITPYPKALAIDDGSWGLLPELRPRTAPEADYLVGRQWQVPLPESAISDGAVPRLIVLTRYERGAASHMAEIPRAEALIELLQQTFAVHRQRRRDMQALAAVLEHCVTYRLTVGSLDCAVQLVSATVRATAPPDTRLGLATQ